MNSLCRFVIQSSPVVTLVALVCSTNAGKLTAVADASSRLALGVIRCGEGGRFQIEDQRRNGTYVKEKCIGPLPATWQLPMSDHNTAHSNTCSVEAGWGGRRRMVNGERSRVRIGRIGSGQGPKRPLAPVCVVQRSMRPHSLRRHQAHGPAASDSNSNISGNRWWIGGRGVDGSGTGGGQGPNCPGGAAVASSGRRVRP